MTDNGQLLRIPLSQIRLIDRDRKDMGDLDDLAASIRENGQITAGVVRTATEDDEHEGVDPTSTPYVLVAGGRRYAACAIAGLDTFLAADFGTLSPLRQKILEAEENLHRKDLTWHELAENRRKVHALRTLEAEAEGKTWTLQDTANELRESVATISRDIQVAEEIAKDVTLKEAGSKKAAVRLIEYRAHTARQEARLARSAGSNLRDRLACADARQWLRTEPSGSVDLLLSDLPYGIGYHSTGRKDQPDVYSSDYDDSEGVTLDLFVDVVPEFIRVTKETGWLVIFMSESNKPFLQELLETCCTVHYDYGEIVYRQDDNGDWEKIMPTFCKHTGTPNCSFLRAEVPGWIWFRPNSRNPGRFPELHAKNFYEHILVLNRGGGRLYRHQDDCPNVLVHDAEYGQERIHSNQKPRTLAVDIITRTTLVGELVCDPFAGSGNLLAGAAELHRQIRGCELNALTHELALGNVGQVWGG